MSQKTFLQFNKKGNIVEDGKISDGHVIFEDYLVCEKIWNKFKMKNMCNYHNHYFKKRCFCFNRCI